MARRSLARDRWRALLILALIGLPVLGITTAALLLQTAIPTAEERATRSMGRADLRAMPIGPFGRAELAALLPTGSVIEPVWSAGDRVVMPGIRRGVSLLYADLDGLAAGTATLLEGDLADAPDEVAITRALATLAGAGIGDTLELESTGQVRVVGIIEDPRALSALLAVGDPALAETPDLVPGWLVQLPPGTSSLAIAEGLMQAPDQTLAEDGIAQSMFDVSTRDQSGQASEVFVLLAVLLGTLALVEAALVAAAAFAVGIRRRQRELGLLGAAGATPRQLAGSVLTEGLVAGVVAVAAGIGMGVVVAWLISLRLDDLVGQRTGALELDLGVLVLAALVGVGAAVIAAAVPAWAAGRLPTLVALSGRRPPTTPSRRLLAVGGLLIAVAVACTVGAPVVGNPTDALPLLLLVVGAVAGVLGFGACSPWLLERLDRVAPRLPLAPRVALRDTARARTRNGPIVTAVLASMAGAIALAAILASQQAQSERWFRPSVASDSMEIQGSAAAGARVAAEMGAVGYGPDRWATGPDGAWEYAVVMPLLHPDPADDMVDHDAGFVVGDEHLLRAHHGDAAIDAFRAGATVVLESRRGDPDSPWGDEAWATTGDTGSVVRNAYDERTGQSDQSVVGGVPVARIPARGDTMTGTIAVMPTETAASLGLLLDQQATQYLVRLDHDITQADVDRAVAIAMAVDPDVYVSSPLPPPDPMLGFRLLMLGAAIVAALTVTAIAVALGESEARADQRTLLALGAPRGLRRRITASRGLVVAALAGLLAIPAGLLPVWGLLAARDWPIVVPLPEVIGALVVLPLAAVVGGLLLGRPLPEWAARRDPES